MVTLLSCQNENAMHYLQRKRSEPLPVAQNLLEGRVLNPSVENSRILLKCHGRLTAGGGVGSGAADLPVTTRARNNQGRPLAAGRPTHSPTAKTLLGRGLHGYTLRPYDKSHEQHVQHENNLNSDVCLYTESSNGLSNNGQNQGANSCTRIWSTDSSNGFFINIKQRHRTVYPMPRQTWKSQSSIWDRIRVIARINRNSTRPVSSWLAPGQL